MRSLYVDNRPTRSQNRFGGPEKTIESGSYRVSPTGEQKGLQQIPLARSESHIIDLIENICDEAKNFKRVVNTLTGKAVYVHKDSTYLRGEEDGKLRAKLLHSCSDFIDDNEEEILKFLTKSHEDPVKEFCHKIKGTCSSVDVSPLPSNDPPEEESENAPEIQEDEL